MKADGIVFRYRDRCWYAPLSGPFICRGAIRGIGDPEGFFDSMPGNTLALVDAEEMKWAVSLQELGRVSVKRNGTEDVEIGDMIRSEDTRDVLQGLIGDALKEP